MYLRQIIPKRCLAARKAAERLKNKTAENKIWPRAQKKREWSPNVRKLTNGSAQERLSTLRMLTNRAETEGKRWSLKAYVKVDLLLQLCGQATYL
ncbi:hypothetical protein NPIL_353011 [Nephila pilipes]|uniref:Uncharacterized protein n=1 Tax=Nephila pilipes TaxID=299642 RepID=A0A8X6PL62_NEPPI|nr:hypothetical protein NPIL_353011 [Nephila pilipes]